MKYEDNKDADWLAYSRILFNTFVVMISNKKKLKL